MIAALFVEKGGVYDGLDGVDPWDLARDARLYAGPFPVVAHPPCERWGNYANGGPGFRGAVRPVLGDDGMCFAAALRAVCRWGGVLEHPAGSRAWNWFGLMAPPRKGGWVSADRRGGWTCCVDQGHYGHRASKATWLYARYADPLPDLTWGAARKTLPLEGLSVEERARAIKTGVCQNLSRKQRLTTPVAFRDVLIAIARSARAAELIVKSS